MRDSATGVVPKVSVSKYLKCVTYIWHLDHSSRWVVTKVARTSLEDSDFSLLVLTSYTHGEIVEKFP